MTKAVIPFFAYQNTWCDDRSRFKIYLKSRQIGITFCEVQSIVEYLMIKPNERWFYLTVSEDRAAEAVEYASKFAKAIGILAKPKKGDMSFGGVKYKHCSLTLPNKSKLIGLPSNPRTARGASGNLTLDEFAWQLHAKEIWTAVNAYQMWGYRLHIVTTPNGKQGEFYRIWTHDRKFSPEEIRDTVDGGSSRLEGDVWTRHITDIFDAKKAGHPVDIDLCRQLAGTQDVFDQEYGTRFLDEASAWLPYELIESCTDGRASISWNDYDHEKIKKKNKRRRALYAGFDVARKRDLSVLWILEDQDGHLVTRAVISMRDEKFSTQKAIVWNWLRKVDYCCIDATGIGAQIAEEAETEFLGKAQGVTFAGQEPAKLASSLKELLERRKISIPDDEEVRRDLMQLRRVYTDAGNVRFEAPRTKDGHADRCWALALAIRASDNASEMIGNNYRGAGSGSRYYDDDRRRSGGTRSWTGY